MNKKTIGVTNINQILFDSRIGADLILIFGEKEELCHSLFFKLKFPNFQIPDDKHEFYEFNQIKVYHFNQKDIDIIIKYIYDILLFEEVISFTTLPFFQKMDFIQIKEKKLIKYEKKINKSSDAITEIHSYKASNDFFMHHENFSSIKSLKYSYILIEGKEFIALEFEVYDDNELLNLLNNYKIHSSIYSKGRNGDLTFYKLIMNDELVKPDLQILMYIIHCLNVINKHVPSDDLKVHIKQALTYANKIKGNRY